MNTDEISRLLKLLQLQKAKGNDLMVNLAIESLLEEFCEQVASHSKDVQFRDVAIEIMKVISAK